MQSINRPQRTLMTLAGVIWILVLVYSLASGDFEEVSMLRKSLQVFLALFGAYWIWLAWGRQGPASRASSSGKSPTA